MRRRGVSLKRIMIDYRCLPNPGVDQGGTIDAGRGPLTLVFANDELQLFGPEICYRLGAVEAFSVGTIEASSKVETRTPE